MTTAAAATYTLVPQPDNKQRSSEERHHRPSQASKKQIREYFTDTLKSQRAYAIAIFDTLHEISVTQFRAGQRATLSYSELSELVGCSLNTTKRVIRGLCEIELISDVPGENPRAPRVFEISGQKKQNGDDPMRNIVSSGDRRDDFREQPTVLKGQIEQDNRPQGTAKENYLSSGDSKTGVICPQGTDESLGEAISSGLSGLSINESRIDSLRIDSYKNESLNRLSQPDRDVLRFTLKSILTKLEPGTPVSGADIITLYNLFDLVKTRTSIDDFIAVMRQGCDVILYQRQNVRRPIPYFFGFLRKTLITQEIGETPEQESEETYQEEPEEFTLVEQVSEPVPTLTELGDTPPLVTWTAPLDPSMDNAEINITRPEARKRGMFSWALAELMNQPGFKQIKTRLRSIQLAGVESGIWYIKPVFGSPIGTNDQIWIRTLQIAIGPECLEIRPIA